MLICRQYLNRNQKSGRQSSEVSSSSLGSENCCDPASTGSAKHARERMKRVLKEVQEDESVRPSLLCSLVLYSQKCHVQSEVDSW